MLKLSLDSILKYLQSKNYDALLQPETQQVYMIYKIEDFEFPIFIRIVDDNLLQLLAFFPNTTKPGAVANLARTLHLLNKEIDIPGFGMDEDNGLVFFRYMLPVSNQELDENLLNKFIEAIKSICATFLHLIVAVSQNAISFEDVAKKIRTSQETNK